jgi:hypothetical protein
LGDNWSKVEKSDKVIYCEQKGTEETKKVIQMRSQDNRKIVNVFYVESFKKYNAMSIEEE